MIRTKADRIWWEEVKMRLPMMQPGTLVVSSEGIGVFMGNLVGSNRIHGVKRGDRMILESCPSLSEYW